MWFAAKWLTKACSPAYPRARRSVPANQKEKKYVIMAVTLGMRGSSLASHPPSWKCCSSQRHYQNLAIVNKSSWMVPKKNCCLTMRRICQDMMRTEQLRKTDLHLTLKQKRNPHYNKGQRELWVILCETAVHQIFFVWPPWKSKLPSKQYIEYSRDNCWCFCLFPMDVCCTLPNLSYVLLLADTLPRASVSGFCAICATKHLQVCATNGCSRLNTTRSSEFKTLELIRNFIGLLLNY